MTNFMLPGGFGGGKWNNLGSLNAKMQRTISSLSVVENENGVQELAQAQPGPACEFERISNEMNSIRIMGMAKRLQMGQRLSQHEMAILREQSLGLYQKAQRMERAREQYQRMMRRARTREEAHSMNMQMLTR